MSTDTTEYGSLREKIRAEKDARLARYASFETLVAAAHSAGMAAGAAAIPPVMIVEQHEHPLDDNSPVKQRWVEPEGPCGFAWVKVKPATSSFARWLVKSGRASKAYQGGVQIWVGEFGQSLDRKAAYAAAYAGVLNTDPDLGVQVYAQSRMD